MRPISSMKFNDSAPQQNWQAIRLICERGAQAPLGVQTAFCRHTRPRVMVQPLCGQARCPGPEGTALAQVMTVQYNEEVESLQQVLPSSCLKSLKRSCAGSRRSVPTHDGRNHGDSSRGG